MLKFFLIYATCRILCSRRDARPRFSSVLSYGFPVFLYYNYLIFIRRHDNSYRAGCPFLCLLYAHVYYIYWILSRFLRDRRSYARRRSVSMASHGVWTLLLSLFRFCSRRREAPCRVVWHLETTTVRNNVCFATPSVGFADCTASFPRKQPYSYSIPEFVKVVFGRTVAQPSSRSPMKLLSASLVWKSYSSPWIRVLFKGLQSLPSGVMVRKASGWLRTLAGQGTFGFHKTLGFSWVSRFLKKDAVPCSWRTKPPFNHFNEIALIVCTTPNAIQPSKCVAGGGGGLQN
jgi:hypothetical protein